MHDTKKEKTKTNKHEINIERMKFTLKEIQNRSNQQTRNQDEKNEINIKRNLIIENKWKKQR